MLVKKNEWKKVYPLLLQFRCIDSLKASFLFWISTASIGWFSNEIEWLLIEIFRLLCWIYKFWSKTVTVAALIAGHDVELNGLARLLLITHFFGYPAALLIVTVYYNIKSNYFVRVFHRHLVDIYWLTTCPGAVGNGRRCWSPKYERLPISRRRFDVSQINGKIRRRMTRLSLVFIVNKQRSLFVTAVNVHRSSRF